MVAMTRGLRNNNPGNIEYGPFAIKYGATGSDGRFAIFPDMPSGICALCELLIVYSTKPDGHGGLIDTVEEAINRWAPNNENHTAAYVALVCTVLDCRKDDRFDFTKPDFLWWMTVGIGEEENGPAVFNQYVKDTDIDEGVRRALA